MLQRIQTIYFLAAIALTVATACVNVGRFILPDGTSMPWGSCAWWPLVVLLSAVALLLAAATALYRRRLLQVRLGIFSALLIVGWYVLFFWHGFYSHSVLDADANYVAGISFSPQWTAALPAVAVVAVVAAVRAVLRDEMLVRSLDRLR